MRNREPRTGNLLYARIAIRANGNPYQHSALCHNAHRSQPRHNQQALASPKHPLWVQGVALARRKVPETSRNGFWRKISEPRELGYNCYMITMEEQRI
jgi:hypothetical protein